MLGEIFYWIFNVSIVSAVCFLPVLIIRFIKKLPRRIFIWLWLIPFIRLCIPIGVSSKYGIMALISRFTTKTVTIFEIGENTSFTAMNCIMGANSYFPITYKINILENVFNVASLVWIVISLALIMTLTIIYIATMKEIKSSINIYENVYVSDKVKIPAVYGIINPKIILPVNFQKSTVDYVLMHEKAHIKRKDNLVKLLSLIIVCFHWFNPFAWIMLKLFYSDIELACDEAVLSKCNDAQKKEYAYTLLSSVEKTSVFLTSFGGAKIRVRIENIISYKRMYFISAFVFFINCCVIVLPP